MSGTLLQTGNEKKNSGSDALFRTKNDMVSPQIRNQTRVERMADVEKFHIFPHQPG